jgi:hypothetical protein
MTRPHRDAVRHDAHPTLVRVKGSIMPYTVDERSPAVRKGAYMHPDEPKVSKEEIQHEKLLAEQLYQEIQAYHEATRDTGFDPNYDTLLQNAYIARIESIDAMEEYLAVWQEWKNMPDDLLD